MDAYNAFADLLMTFRSLSDSIKALVIVAPNVTLIAIFGLFAFGRRPKT